MEPTRPPRVTSRQFWRQLVVALFLTFTLLWTELVPWMYAVVGAGLVVYAHWFRNEARKPWMTLSLVLVSCMFFLVALSAN